MVAWFVVSELPHFIVLGIYSGPPYPLDNYTFNGDWRRDIINNYDDWDIDNMIAPVPGPSLFFKYYIGNKGAVLRWGKMHRIIKAKFKQLKAGNA